MVNAWRFFWALLRANLKASMALRGAFWLQAVLMAFNNLVFFVMWWILFDRFESVRGWTLHDMYILFGVSATGTGIANVCFGGLRDLAQRISDGDLDTWLTQPKSVLLQAAAARSIAHGWGDIASGLVLLGLGTHFAPDRWGAIALALFAAMTVCASISAIYNAGAFWVGRVEGLAFTLWAFLLAFSVYPEKLFTGALRVFLFTLMPAGFMAYLPASMVRAPSLVTALSIVAGALLYLALAVFTFQKGLARYTSGNRMVVRGF